MFTIIITKDQSGGINDNVVIAQLARDLCLSVNTPRPQASVSKFVIKGLSGAFDLLLTFLCSLIQTLT